MRLSKSEVQFIEETKEKYIVAAKELSKKAKRNQDLLQEVIAEMENRGLEFWSRMPVGGRMDVKMVMNLIGKELLSK